MKTLFNIAGSIAVALAVLGIFLPLLPTTPFLLLACACFMRGSPRMHRWLVSNRLFGKYLRDIQNVNGLPLRSRLAAIGVMWVSLGFSAYIVPFAAVKVLLLVIGVAVSLYILIRLRQPLRMPGSNSH